MNKNKFSIIKINGFKGIALVVFLIGCFAAGFMIFPGWLCMNIWNFVASYFNSLPHMELLHGCLLWAIIALSFYALNSDVFSISFGSARPRPIPDERIKEIIKQINDRNSTLLHSNLKDDIIENIEEEKSEK